MPFDRQAFDKRLLGRAAVSSVLVTAVIVVTGQIGFMIGLPGFLLGFILGLIPFEGEAIGSYLMVGAVFNFIIYTVLIYCGLLIIARGRVANA